MKEGVLSLAEALEPGAVVKDQYGCVGIIMREDARPAESWIKEQVHMPEQAKAEGINWWAVAPLTGGMLLAPSPVLTFLRPATYEDFVAAVDHSTDNGRRNLSALFPTFSAAALASLKG
jgi:hypothetical protein